MVCSTPLINIGKPRVSRSDWNYLKKQLMELYVKILKFPGYTILATGDREPGEKQNLKQTVPDMTTGSAQRALIDIIGNVLNVYNVKGTYGIKLQADPKTFAKNKIKKIYSKKELPTDVDLTGRPEAFWELFFEFRNEGIEKKISEKPNMENLSIEVSEEGEITKAEVAIIEKEATKSAPVTTKTTPAKASTVKAPAKTTTAVKKVAVKQ
jgi:hypothetical protein